MSDLIDTTEMYLKTVYELEEEGVVPMRARIAERLGHSGPTVSQTVARMERDGLLHLEEGRRIALSEAGREKATRVMRKHRLAERLLTDVIGLEWEYVHEEACRWEHVMSEQVEHRLVALLDHPHHDPYGNPIPGLAELGEISVAAGASQLRQLAAVDGEDEVVLRRIGEPLQVDVELLARFAEVGIRPGARLRLQRGPGFVSLRAEGSELVLDVPADVTRHLFVDA
ncbi:metal-dependent transcriptional regulator [Georgenia sp. 311]|uniref:Metal-dependent transcriptional regulator n=1 Tax=Georgenia wutianyii TaxID=2585135 RepID=A0ABX5VIR3_9MICO|nr:MULTISPECIES: metal-dependent transcriptional regulator [Georgenia]QDB78252.1 metal-dependent transcriptional regulator [Georgenia wutianyii]TNC18798.1 metal-dependent transcriptional regulator [Georgenia sp. 311]